jgi:hypothetical protein
MRLQSLVNLASFTMHFRAVANKPCEPKLESLELDRQG